MGDGLRKVEIIPDYFQASTSSVGPNGPGNPLTSTHILDSQQSEDSTTSTSGVYIPHFDSRLQPSAEISSSLGRSYLSTQRKLRRSRLMSRLFSLRHLPFTGSDGEEKVEISSTELESLRSELADLEEKEAHLKAQLEHLDQILLRARLSGYLHIRTRWTAMPGEPPVLDDCEVDDWIPRFVVLQGQCLFLYLSSIDLSPQDTTLLSDIIELGSLPDIEREDEDRRYCFFISTRYGLRMECSSISKIQVHRDLSGVGRSKHWRRRDKDYTRAISKLTIKKTRRPVGGARCLLGGAHCLPWWRPLQTMKSYDLGKEMAATAA